MFVTLCYVYANYPVLWLVAVNEPRAVWRGGVAECRRPVTGLSLSSELKLGREGASHGQWSVRSYAWWSVLPVHWCYCPTVLMEVASAFESSKIVPDVVSAAPPAALTLTYPSGAEAAAGNELTPTQVKDQPTVSYDADADSFYTLVFTDPDNYDGPEPVYREWHHWLVGNIPGGSVVDGEVLSGYIGSGPPEGTGIHRYVYVLFKQPGKLEFDEKKLTNTSIDGRAGFSTKKFAEKYGLGVPVAGNFYRAQFDDYVPLLYKSLGV